MKVLSLGSRIDNRAKKLLVQRRAKHAHFVIAALLFIYILNGIDSANATEMMARFGRHLSYGMSVIGAYLVAHYFTLIIMLIPSWLFVRMASPQILLTDNHLIFLGGSIALNYGWAINVLSPLIYILGTEESQILARDEIRSISIRKRTFLSSGFGRWRFIVIEYKCGSIRTGGSIKEEEQNNVVEILNNWRKAP